MTSVLSLVLLISSKFSSGYDVAGAGAEKIFNRYSAGIDYSRQNLTSVDVRL